MARVTLAGQGVPPPRADQRTPPPARVVTHSRVSGCTPPPPPAPLPEGGAAAHARRARRHGAARGRGGMARHAAGGRRPSFTTRRGSLLGRADDGGGRGSPLSPGTHPPEGSPPLPASPQPPRPPRHLFWDWPNGGRPRSRSSPQPSRAPASVTCPTSCPFPPHKRYRRKRQPQRPRRAELPPPHGVTKAPVSPLEHPRRCPSDCHPSAREGGENRKAPSQPERTAAGRTSPRREAIHMASREALRHTRRRG